MVGGGVETLTEVQQSLKGRGVQRGKRTGPCSPKPVETKKNPIRTETSRFGGNGKKGGSVQKGKEGPDHGLEAL